MNKYKDLIDDIKMLYRNLTMAKTQKEMATILYDISNMDVLIKTTFGIEICFPYNKLKPKIDNLYDLVGRLNYETLNSIKTKKDVCDIYDLIMVALNYPCIKNELYRKQYVSIIKRKEDMIQDLENDYDTHYDVLLELMKFYGEIDFRITDRHFNKVFNYDEANDLITKFFASINQKYLYLRNKDKILVGTNFNDHVRALTFYFKTLNKSYVVYRKSSFNIETMTYLVHEHGHSIDYQLGKHYRCKNYSDHYRSYYNELNSTLLERMFLDFAYENNLPYKDYLLCKSRKDYAMYRFLKDLFYFLNIAYSGVTFKNFEIEPHILDKESLETLFEMTNLDFSMCQEGLNVKDDIYYGYGNLISLYLIEQKKNGVDIFKSTNDLRASSSICRGFEALKHLNIDITDLSVPKERIKKTNQEFKKTFHLY